MYVVQTFLHSLIAILFIERAIQIWDIKNPLTHYRYRLMTLILPITMFPLYNLVNLNRGSLLFRDEKAIFNVNRWLAIEIWDIIPVSMLFQLFLLVTAITFFLQEIIPIIKDAVQRVKVYHYNTLPVDTEIESMVSVLSESLGIEKPRVNIINDKNPVILTTGAKSHTIVLSSGLVEILDREQLYSAIAHEFAHIVRRSNVTSWMIFIIRILMFFNPIVLIVFRRIVQDDEHICDDLTISLTEKPLVLASTLKVFYSSDKKKETSMVGRITSIKREIENHSHNLLLKERIERLESSNMFENKNFEWGKFLLTAGTIIIINYFVV